jgi:hypothetical protein
MSEAELYPGLKEKQTKLSIIKKWEKKIWQSV